MPGVFRAGRSQVNPRRRKVGMPQNIRQFHDISAHPVKGAGEKMPEIMRKYLRFQNPRRRAQFLHLRPDLLPREALSASGDKNLSGDDFFLPGIPDQLSAELLRHQNRTYLTLQGDFHSAFTDRLQCNILYLADPDSGSAYRLQQQRQAFFSLRFCRFDQSFIFPAEKLLFRTPEKTALNPQCLCSAFLPARKPEKRLSDVSIAFTVTGA